MTIMRTIDAESGREITSDQSLVEGDLVVLTNEDEFSGEFMLDGVEYGYEGLVPEGSIGRLVQRQARAWFFDEGEKRDTGHGAWDVQFEITVDGSKLPLCQEGWPVYPLTGPQRIALTHGEMCATWLDRAPSGAAFGDRVTINRAS